MSAVRILVMRLGNEEVRLMGDNDSAIRDSAEFAALASQGYSFGGSWTQGAGNE